MTFTKVPHNILLLVTLTALLMLLSLDTASAIRCKKGCKLNRKNKYVCIGKRNQVITCFRTAFAMAFPPDAAPGPITDQEQEYIYIPDYDEPLGYVYDYEDRRYEYEDGTVVPGFETFSSIVPTVPTGRPSKRPSGGPPSGGRPSGPPSGRPSRPPRVRRCRRRDPPCSDGCKRGRCCLDGQRSTCVDVLPGKDASKASDKA
jgi:hypothetical protein